MGLRRLFAGVTLVIGLLAFARPVAAQNPWGLTVDVLSSTTLIRPNRPTLIYLDFQKQSPSIVEGELKIELLSGSRVLATCTNDAFVLGSPRQTVRQLLPALSVGQGIDSVDMRLTLITPERTVRLSVVPLRTEESLGRRISVAALATNPLTSIRESRANWDDWRWERLAPEGITERGFQTVVHALDVAQWPTDPLAYCTFDILIVPAGSFSSLRGDQLEAVLAWVRAGGSLYVEGAARQSDRHEAFLATLGAEGDAPRPVRTAKESTLSAGDEDGPLRLVVGWGRVVLDDGYAAETGERRLADESLAWLWRMELEVLSEATVPALLRGVPSPDGDADMLADITLSNLEERLAVAQSLEVAGRRWARAAQAFLMPTESSPVPLGVIALVLLGYLAVIGPGDWLVLGWARRRKWTWVSFPIATVVATATLTQFANAYLSVAERPRAVEILDADRSGRIVRRNEFLLTYVNSARQVETPLRQSLVTSLDAAENPWERRESRPIDLRGQFPTGYRVSERFAQWTPSLSRRLRIPREPEDLPFDWDATFPELADFDGRPADQRAAVLREYLQDLGRRPERLRLPGGEMLGLLWHFPGGSEGTANAAQLLGPLNQPHYDDHVATQYGYGYGSRAEVSLQSHRFLSEGTVYPRHWRLLFTGASPSGGRSGFDLAYSPRPGKFDSVLSVIIRSDERTTVVRRPLLEPDRSRP